MRNSGLGEMFHGLVSSDMMYCEGLVSSYLVSISLSISECNIWDSLTWGHLTQGLGGPWPPLVFPHVFPISAECQISSSAPDTCHDDVCQNSRGFCLNKAPGVWHLRSKEVKLQVFTKICFDTNTYYVKLRVCWSRKVIMLSNVNIYGRQHISNSSWWAVNFDPRLEEILQASVPCLLERERVPSLLIHFMRRGKCQVPGGEWCPGWLGCDDDDDEDTGGIILCQCGVNNRVSRCHLSYGVTQS